MKNYDDIINTLINEIDNTKNTSKLEQLEIIENVLVTCKSYHNKIKRLRGDIDYFKKNKFNLYYNNRAINQAKSELSDLYDQYNFYKQFYNNMILEQGLKKTSFMIK